MAVKSKEMSASAMKVVIRKHLVCVSLTVKIGAGRSAGARGNQKAGLVLFQREAPVCGSDKAVSPDLVVCTDSGHSAHSSFLKRPASPPSRGLLERQPWEGPAGPEAAARHRKKPRLWVPPTRSPQTYAGPISGNCLSSCLSCPTISAASRGRSLFSWGLCALSHRCGLLTVNPPWVWDHVLLGTIPIAGVSFAMLYLSSVSLTYKPQCPSDLWVPKAAATGLNVSFSPSKLLSLALSLDLTCPPRAAWWKPPVVPALRFFLLPSPRRTFQPF